MSPIDINDVRWWLLFAVAGVPCLTLLFRTVAVVVIARCVKTDVAKMAIPLVLRPVRPSLFPMRKRVEVSAYKTAGKL